MGELRGTSDVIDLAIYTAAARYQMALQAIVVATTLSDAARIAELALVAEADPRQRESRA